LSVVVLSSGSVKAAPVMKKATNADGAILRFKGETNLNGFSEWMVKWDECQSGKGLVNGQVTWDYNAMKADVSWPTTPSMMVACAPRAVSEVFVNFLNKHLSYCVALATVPKARQEVSATLLRVDDKSDASGVDNAIVAAVQRAERSQKSEIATAVSELASIQILHQGIIGDEHHTNHSYHAAEVLRAIDISHIRATTTAGVVKTYQHNVGTYAENLEIAGKADKKSTSQLVQQRFWQAFGACMTAKGAGVISKQLHHTGSGKRHAGHMHISLPFHNRGKYNTKDVDPGHRHGAPTH